MSKLKPLENDKQKEKNKMTDKEILEDILSDYNSNLKRQSEIAKKYHVRQNDISILLQECGIHYNKIDNGKPVDINIALQNPEVQRICKKIHQSIQ